MPTARRLPPYLCEQAPRRARDQSISGPMPAGEAAIMLATAMLPTVGVEFADERGQYLTLITKSVLLPTVVAVMFPRA